METVTVFLVLVAFSCGSVLSQEFNGECYVGGVPTRCEPVQMSFSLGQEATASSTCGDTPSSYCVRSVRLGRVSSDCSGDDICDAAGDPGNAHPAAYLTDFPLTETWWQSENSLNTETQVVIDVPLLTLAEITVISFYFQTIKPAAFRLERSVDNGVTYQPYHHFAVSCEDQYGISPDVELIASNETSVRCQAITEPPIRGILSFFPAIDRPSTNDSIPGYSEVLYSFITATNIRIILDQHYALDLADDDPGYYYALEDINVIGSCQCFGHASGCIENFETGEYECVCRHNTAGQYCEQCQEFYHDVPWQRADGSGPFECKMCNCNNHSSECVFDPMVYEQTGQSSGGVCVACDGNTAGQQCETCAPFYFPRPDRIQTDPDVCEDCGCLLDGVTDNGDCAKEDDGVHQPGDCYCKANVIGRKCDMCALGYYNISAENPEGCQVCDCSLNGSSSQMCNHITGECECKPNVVGAQCDSCRLNYYQPDFNEGCLPCDCNLGGSTSAQCDMTTGQCTCQPGVSGRTCSETIAGYFFPTIDYLRLEGEFASSIPSSPLIASSGEGELFTGTGHYRVVEQQGIANFGTLVMPVSGTYEVLFRYNLMGALIWNTATVTIRAGNEEVTGAADCGVGIELPVGDTSVQYTSWTVGTGLAISRSFCFRAGRSYTFILSELVSGQASSPTLDIDSLVAIPIDAPSLAVFGDSQLVSDYSSCVASWRRVPTISSAEPTCEATTFTFSTAVYIGTLECDCDPDGSMVGTDCEAFGGQCVCLPGVRGRRCDECSPGTFDFSPTGCTSCSCSTVGSSSDLCQPEQGTCDCLPNVVGPNCSMCETNFWGLTAGLGCTLCSCNEMGSSSLQCNQVTGECVCRPGVIGTQCDQCQEDHYRFSDTGCSPCDCNQAGSLGPDCEVVIGQCDCKDNTRTRECSSCVSGTFNLQASNPSGCQPCFCSRVDATCTAAPGYVATNISTEFSSESLDLQGWSVVSANFTPHSDPDSVVTTMPFSSGVTILPDSVAYLQAPPQYLGNRLSSYLQFITISLEPLSASIGVESIAQYDIILTGSSLQLGAQFPVSVITGNSVLQIQLHESYGWNYVADNEVATASDIQAVLLSLENIFITANFNSSIILDSIRLDTVEETTNLDDPTFVTWVEQCDCPVSYSGLSCQQCASGYTRSPSGSCELCQCSELSTTCDPETGTCTDCTGSATGASCEQCLPGTYGNPTQGIPCLPCPCPQTTTPGQFTDKCLLVQSGSVVCVNCPVGHVGDRCESCSDGYFGDPTGENGTPTGCSDCLCSGNINSSLPGSCNTTTGICLQCIGNTAGNTCERCADGYYGDAIDAKNCSACECNPIGSASSMCDHMTGQCPCLPNVEGTRCDQCSLGHYGLSGGSGCTLCNCNPQGSVDSQCDLETGQCSCRPGVTGSLCDQCITGFFGLSENGCQACNCSATNSILTTCDASGVCQCQAGSTGPNCETCTENFFQDSQGCTECPQCYQELEAMIANTTATVDTTESILFNLLIETSPYEPRLEDQQSEVQDIVESAQSLSQQHDILQMQVDDLTNAIEMALLQDVAQLDSTLQTLKIVSTPVFVLALAAEELMNRTIEQFLTAEEEINLLRDFYIPNINQSVSAISNSRSVSREALQALMSQVQLLSDQENMISEQVGELQSLASMALQTAEGIDSQHENTKEVAASLQQNLTSIEEAVISLTQQLDAFMLEIMQIHVRTQEQRNNLPSIPSAAEIDVLSNDVSTTQNDISMLENTLSDKQSELNLLHQNLNQNRVEVDSLTQDISDLTGEAESLADRAQEAGNRSATAVEGAQRRINEAEQVLDILQDYSSDTFEVARRANEALELVEEIAASASYTIATASAIQENVSDIMEVVDDAMDKTDEAENIADRIEMDLSGVDTATLLTNVSASQSDIEYSRDRAMELEMAAQGYKENLSSLEENISTSEQLVQSGSLLADESEALRNQANDTVDAIEKALLDLQALDSSKLQEIQDSLTALESELSSADIESLYGMLAQSFSEQRALRHELQQSLASMQAEVDYLRHVESVLPPACDSNL